MRLFACDEMSSAGNRANAKGSHIVIENKHYRSYLNIEVQLRQYEYGSLSAVPTHQQDTGRVRYEVPPISLLFVRPRIWSLPFWSNTPMTTLSLSFVRIASLIPSSVTG